MSVSDFLILQPDAGGSIFSEAAAASGILLPDIKDEDPNARIAEMQRRNAKYLPHLKSAYPIESQVLCDSKLQFFMLFIDH